MNYIDKNEQEELKAFQEQAEETKEAWHIEDLSSANWVLRMLSRLNKEKNNIERLAEEEINRIQTWRDKETNQMDGSIEFFSSKLEDYLLIIRQDNPKAKIKTPYGSVSTRKVPAKFHYDKQIIEELKAKGLESYIRISEEVNRAELKKVLTPLPDGRVVNENGEVLEHVIVEPEHEKLTIRTEE